ncbi:16612_t:CDS:2 [Cetraspora pellucida]|uniref:16612_t:CDS:1 n=1 Tax=Cetraspora pellucida TaxID=1433469 RepID=A0A9N9F9J7_9GLOM|nr:16612_t:CDS:2 [Cetraspora pellucida]
MAYQQTPQTNGYNRTPQMTVGVPVQEKPGGRREWRFGLFDCFSDCGLCFKTWCLPCVTFGETKAKLNNTDCCGSCCLFCCCPFIAGGMGRGEIRGRLNIKGTCCGDFCTHWCCPLCALVQEHREVHSL